MSECIVNVYYCGCVDFSNAKARKDGFMTYPHCRHHYMGIKKTHMVDSGCIVRGLGGWWQYWVGEVPFAAVFLRGGCFIGASIGKVDGGFLARTDTNPGGLR